MIPKLNSDSTNTHNTETASKPGKHSQTNRHTSNKSGWCRSKLLTEHLCLLSEVVVSFDGLCPYCVDFSADDMLTRHVLPDLSYAQRVDPVSCMMFVNLAVLYPCCVSFVDDMLSMYERWFVTSRCEGVLVTILVFRHEYPPKKR